jgi:ribosomal protein S18 acetylase RimI-like enzyme
MSNLLRSELGSRRIVRKAGSVRSAGSGFKDFEQQPRRLSSGYPSVMSLMATRAATAPPVEIAPPTDADLGQLYSLAQGTFGAIPGWSDEQVIDVLRRDVIFVARERTLPAGYVALRPDRATESIVIEQIFVAPGHQQRGIGHRLLAHAEGYAIAEKARAIRIVAEESNWRARSFYGRVGFVPVESELLELVLPRLG